MSKHDFTFIGAINAKFILPWFDLERLHKKPLAPLLRPLPSWWQCIVSVLCENWSGVLCLWC